MENNNDVYKHILEQIKNLLSKESSLDKIEVFLQMVDDISYNKSIKEFGDDFLIPFYSLMNRKINDTISVGDLLLNNSLENKINLSPSLLIYFYLKQKDELGFNDSYNKFKLYSEAGQSLAYTAHDEDKHIYFNFNKYKKDYQNPEEYNYECMEAIMHEIAHIYQFSISQDTEDIFEMLIYHDRQVFDLCQDSNLIGYIGLHDCYGIENYANIFSKHFMINFAKLKPTYFSEQLITKKREKLLNYSNSCFKESFRGSRFHFYHILENYVFGDKINLNDIKDTNPKMTDEYIEKLETQLQELERQEWQIVDYIDDNMPDSIEKVYLGIIPNSYEYIDGYDFTSKKSNKR